MDEPVQKFELENRFGMILTIINFGARIVGLKVPAVNDSFVDVVVGYPNLDDYLKDDMYLGAIVGRTSGRIYPAKIKIDKEEYQLIPNLADNVQLHGGIKGFDKVFWKADAIKEETGSKSIRLHHTSPDGAGGYPGTLSCEVLYRLTDNNEVIIEMKAQTDKTTIVSMINHAYFNLGGQDEKNNFNHIVTIHADSYLPVNNATVPTGQIAFVEGTNLDFRKPRKVGDAIKASSTEGVDDCFCLPNTSGDSLRQAATLSHPKTGVQLDISTNQPIAIMYTGQCMHQTSKGKNGEDFEKYSALCLETSEYPNAINTPTFPSPVLRPGQVYHRTTLWKFSKTQ